jgi:hypothetical protein
MFRTEILSSPGQSFTQKINITISFSGKIEISIVRIKHVEIICGGENSYNM